MAPSSSSSPLPDCASIVAWRRVALPFTLTCFPIGVAAGMAASLLPGSLG